MKKKKRGKATKKEKANHIDALLRSVIKGMKRKTVRKKTIDIEAYTLYQIGEEKRLFADLSINCQILKTI